MPSYDSGATLDVKPRLVRVDRIPRYPIVIIDMYRKLPCTRSLAYAQVVRGIEGDRALRILLIYKRPLNQAHTPVDFEDCSLAPQLFCTLNDILATPISRSNISEGGTARYTSRMVSHVLCVATGVPGTWRRGFRVLPWF